MLKRFSVHIMSYIGALWQAVYMKVYPDQIMHNVYLYTDSIQKRSNSYQNEIDQTRRYIQVPNPVPTEVQNG